MWRNSITKEKISANILQRESRTDIFQGLKIDNVNLFKTSDNVKFKYPADSEEIRLNNENNVLNVLFQHFFSMWEASKKYKEIYRTIYAFPRTEHTKISDIDILRSDKEMIPINSSPEVAEDFLSSLCNRARQILNEPDKVRACKESRFFITGELGSGKTTFLNYLFSNYHDDLANNKVIWVRVDLTKSYHSNKTLSESLKFQIARIIRMHYYQEIEDNIETFKECLRRKFFVLESINPQTELEFNKEYNEYTKGFTRERTKPFHPLIQDGIKEYIEHHFGVIYIYDGLDKIQKEEDFEEKLYDIKEILTSENYRGIYLFVMRYESQYMFLNKYFDTGELFNLTTLRGYGKTFKIEEVKLGDIIEKRLELLAKDWASIMDQKKYSIVNKKLSDPEVYYNDEIARLIKKYEWLDLDTIKAYFKIFLMYLQRALSFEDSDYETFSIEEEQAFRDLKDLIGSNYRLLLNVLILSNRCFLETLQILDIKPHQVTEIVNCLINKKQSDILNFENYKKHTSSILRKYYRIIPALLRSRHNYIHPFKYYYIENSIRMDDSNANNFSPYLFNIYYSINVKNSNQEYYHLLCKIRILQLLSQDSYFEEEIVSKLSSMFFYKKENIRHALVELKAWKYITINPYDYHANKIAYKIVVSRVGKNALDKLIFDFNYIRIILDDILIPNFTKNNFRDPDPQKYDQDKNVWIILQIPRILNFALLIKTLDMIELENINTNDRPLWMFHDKLYDSIINKIERILKAKEGNYEIFKSLLN